MVLANKSLDIIENCGIPKMKSLYSSLKSNTTSQALIVMVVDDYTKCFKQYKNILSKELYKFDDTKDQSFNKSFAYNLNRSDYDRIDGNYLQGVNSSMQLNLTLRAFIDYQATKLKFYANFSSIIINLDTQTKAYAKKIDDHKKKLKYFENIRKTVTKLINGTQATMKNVEESIDILTKDCNAQSTVLKGKIARNKADLKSFEKLIDYFRENYYKISEDLRKKYDSVPVTSSVTKTANSTITKNSNSTLKNTKTTKKSFIQTEEEKGTDDEDDEDDETTDDDE